MPDLECDVAVIGAGTAGLAAERSARRAGARTVLIDDRFAGTTCASVGCMPSKLLIAAAAAAHAVRRAGVFGIAVPAPHIDGTAVMARVRGERDRFVAGTKAGFEDLPQGVMVRAKARFTGPAALALDDGRTVAARAVVIATGSRPAVPEPFKDLGERILTNETVFDLADLPASVAVIGAGPLGLELAQALARLGVEVEVFSQGRILAGLHDAPVADEVRSILAADMPLHLGVRLEASADDDGVLLAWSGADQGSRRFARVLVAVGRRPQLHGLALEAAGLALDRHGTPLFDRATLQCGQTPVFIAGDADADRPVLHEASSEGAIAGRNAASYPAVKPAQRGTALSVMFTDPPLAVVGEPAGEGAVIGSASYADQGRAKVEARAAGLVRLYADPEHGRLTGAAMVGPGMDHLGHLIAWAVERGETAAELLARPFYHPTFEEGLKPALRQICHAVSTTMPADHDEGVPPGACHRGREVSRHGEGAIPAH